MTTSPARSSGRRRAVKATVGEFFDALGDRAGDLGFVTADGDEWIRTVSAEQAPEAVVCIDAFDVVGWATDALDEVRRAEWNVLRQAGDTATAKAFKGLRWVLLWNWENLRGNQKGVIRSLEKANRQIPRAWQLKKEVRDMFSSVWVRPAALWATGWHGRHGRSSRRSSSWPTRSAAIGNRSKRPSNGDSRTGSPKSNNASIGRIRANARGFHDPEAFITMIVLDRAGLAPNLPWATS